MPPQRSRYAVGLPASATVSLPTTDDVRSLNLANAAAIAVYEAWRQLGFATGSSAADDGEG